MKINNKRLSVLRYIGKNPKAKALEIANALGVNRQYVYQVISDAKKKASLPMTAITVDKAEAKKPEDVSNLVFKLSKGRGRPKTRTISVNISKTSVKDNVNHPAHYKVGGIETIDFIEAKQLSYNLGNVVKYLTRADHKGNRKEDLLKAQWYLNREIRNLK
jgi:hypothetical protein